MKKLKDLTQTEFDSLKSAGVLIRLYPNAPSAFSGITKTYTRVQNPNTTAFVNVMETYLNTGTNSTTEKDKLLVSIFKIFFGNDIVNYLKQNIR